MSRADVTRQRILEATRELLESDPGSDASMGDIAAAAGVTRQLLYVHFDNRTALLLELTRLVDDAARTPTLQAAIDSAPDARVALREAVRVQGRIKPQIQGVANSLDRLRRTDEAAAEAWNEREDARHRRCRAVIGRLADEGLLSSDWPSDAAADLLWSATSLRSWEDLVGQRGWSTKKWVDRTVASLEATLIGSAT